VNNEELIAAARAVAAHAYAPFSKFRVGAVAVAGDGTRHVGVNVENSAYPATTCAEAAAVAAAVAAGAETIEVVAVSCIDATEPGYPCGNCRQIMHELGVRRVVVDGPDGPREHALEDLLPHGFRLENRSRGPGDDPIATV
jgi:cytidine deaminase